MGDCDSAQGTSTATAEAASQHRAAARAAVSNHSAGPAPRHGNPDQLRGGAERRPLGGQSAARQTFRGAALRTRRVSGGGSTGSGSAAAAAAAVAARWPAGAAVRWARWRPGRSAAA